MSYAHTLALGYDVYNRVEVQSQIKPAYVRIVHFLSIDMAVATGSRTLHCGIIGAGITGLGAAIALRRAGHDVEIFEKSTFKNEIGAAITMTPNANLILDRWGFDAKRAGETHKQQFRDLDHETLEVKMHFSFEGVPERYGHACNAFHRVDMHVEMRRIAVNLGAELRLACEAVDVDCEQGIIVLKDGRKLKKDLVIIADGIKSSFVTAVTGETIPTRKTGKSAYRTLIPIDRLMADPLVQPLFAKEPSGFLSCVKPKAGLLYMTYPCRDDKLMNFACIHSTKPHQVDAEDWNSPATVEDVLELLADFHPAFSALVKHADTMKCYTVGHRDTLPRMARGKALLIGDSAHPMLPTHAQGGSMGLEDAAALEVLFSDWTSEDSVERRFDLLNQLRLPRDNVTQLISNSMFYQYYNEALTEQDSRLTQYWKGSPFPLTATSFSEPIREFFYGYDAFAEAEKAMKYKDDPNGIPEGAIKHFGP